MPYMKKIKVAIAGATGYTGGELIRILLNHPEAKLMSLLTTSLSGKPVWSIHKDLYGESNLTFTDQIGAPDVLFLCLGHGLSREFLTTNPIPAHCKVIDLGNDFRTDDTFEDKRFVYGVSELFEKDIRQTQYLANPGCFATTIILGLAPLAAQKWLTHDVHIHALTGSTGAGKQLTETSQFSYRSSNISIYKPFQHQHLAEIGKTLACLSSGLSPVINMIPMRGDFPRGIFAAMLVKMPDTVTEEQIVTVYKNFYKDTLFVHFAEHTISLKEVINTNKTLINLHFSNGYIHITSVLDNLLKGASGQAVQNMNLMFGLPEDCGLRLKNIAF
ncbi:N-acetyl-gamma-glutamyl-phosphate reductase [Bacteroidia bacterium]|nr:N-acetyl-gamma-glutamyl-phosphate reductase [Bacteroidia bacterium]